MIIILCMKNNWSLSVHKSFVADVRLSLTSFEVFCIEFIVKFLNYIDLIITLASLHFCGDSISFPSAIRIIAPILQSIYAAQKSKLK